MDIISLRVIDSHKVPGASLLVRAGGWDRWDWWFQAGVSFGLFAHNEDFAERTWGFGLSVARAAGCSEIGVALGPYRFHKDFTPATPGMTLTSPAVALATPVALAEKAVDGR